MMGSLSAAHIEKARLYIKPRSPSGAVLSAGGGSLVFPVSCERGKAIGCVPDNPAPSGKFVARLNCAVVPPTLNFKCCHNCSYLFGFRMESSCNLLPSHKPKAPTP
jgi:hypothetical protein